MRKFSHALRIVLTSIALLVGAIFFPTLGAQATTLSGYYCNSVILSQIPSTNYVVGRRLNPSQPNDSCTPPNQTLVLYSVNWSTGVLTYVRDIFTVGAILPQGEHITTAYDPSVTSFNGELWVAFECYSGNAGEFLNTVASACIGPLNPSTYVIDATRVSVAVLGTASTLSTKGGSASVPKIFVYSGTPYLYWSVVGLRQDLNNPAVSSTQATEYVDLITTRGVQLAQESTGLRRLFASGSI